VLVTSSTDGYCSVITFDQNELGVPVTESVSIPAPSSFPIPLKEVKVKESKPKVSTAKKEKTPGTKKRNGGEKFKTPKSVGDTPDRSTGKKKVKAKPIKLLLEAQAAANNTISDDERKGKKNPDESATTVTKEKLAVASEPEDKDKEIPNPYVHLVRLSGAATTKPSPKPKTPEKDKPEASETENPEKSPAPIKFIPQKNTLDRWVIKKKETKETAKRERSPSPEVLEIIPPKKDRNGTETENPKSEDTSEPMEVQEIPVGTPAVEPGKKAPSQPQQKTILSASVTAENSQSPKQKAPRRVALITLSTTPTIPPKYPEVNTNKDDKPE
jgi:hypothetical protein